jgi:3-hydroxyacyl-CoA dehydrogenase
MPHPPIASVAVLGAGTMGAQLAAHCANAGLRVRLLDLTREAAAQGLKKARALKPDPFFTVDSASLIGLGGFDADLRTLADCDWIIEAVVERLDVKQDLFARIEPHRRADAIVSSNTSGIPIHALGDGRSDGFRRHFLGTHFFNPPRYLPLVEVIPTPETDASIVERLSHMLDRRLGKGVVIAKDTPNFIANRIGLFSVMRVLEAVAAGRYRIEEVDAITGAPLGRPKSATFRTIDISGLDVLAHVTRNLAERTGSAEAHAPFTLPSFVENLLARGWLGEKSGQGFYRRTRTPQGQTAIEVLDPATFEYHAPARIAIPSLEAARSIDDPRERIRMLFASRDRAGEFLRETLAPSLLYTAGVAPEVARSIDDVDRAMRWGFGWELGPFEVLDAIGLRETLEAAGNPPAPPIVEAALAAGRNTIRTAPLPPADPEFHLLRTARDSRRVVKANAGASLVDLGDDVLALEFHSKMNALGADTFEMLNAAVKEASQNFAALVIANEAPAFSAGANLMLLLLEAQDDNWEDIDLAIRTFQRAITSLRTAPVPVIVAPAGVALGGGCEIVLHGERVQAAAETYLGLVEVGVGLIPAGGGTKEMLARAMDARPSPSADPLPFVQRAFETIGFATVSTSAADARRLGFLRDRDSITMNRERLTSDAKALALECARDYRPPAPRTAIPVGGANLLAALKLGLHLAWRAGRISDHDKLVGTKLAFILAGGNLPSATAVSEQYLLDLEREAFLSLCGERKTQERIAHTLKTGKPLRN